MLKSIKSAANCMVKDRVDVSTGLISVVMRLSAACENIGILHQAEFEPYHLKTISAAIAILHKVSSFRRVTLTHHTNQMSLAPSKTYDAEQIGQGDCDYPYIMLGKVSRPYWDGIAQPLYHCELNRAYRPVRTRGLILWN